MGTAQGAEFPLGGPGSQLHGEGDECGTPNQQSHLPCLGQEALTCSSRHPHCPQVPGLWIVQELIQTQITGMVVRGWTTS